MAALAQESQAGKVVLVVLVVWVVRRPGAVEGRERLDREGVLGLVELGGTPSWVVRLRMNRRMIMAAPKWAGGEP
jgi:hypothetical protein